MTHTISVQPQCSDLVDALTWSTIAQTVVGAYEARTGGAGDAQLQLQGAVTAADGRSLVLRGSIDGQREVYFCVFGPAVDGEDGPEMLGSASVPYAALAQAASAASPLTLPLANSVSPLGQQTLSKFRSSITLRAKVATPEEAAQAGDQADGAAAASLPKQVSLEELQHRQRVQLHVSASRLPDPVDADGVTVLPADSCVYLAALFEKDGRTGHLKLQCLTQWTRPRSGASPFDPLRFSSAPLTVDYFPRSQQLFQLSLYRCPLGDSHVAAMSPDVFSQLSEADRLGSAEFMLDYFGLESQMARRNRAAAEQAGLDQPPVMPESAGRVYASPARPQVLQMDLLLSHDLSPALDAALHAAASFCTVSLDTRAYPLERNPAVPLASESLAASMGQVVSTPQKSHQRAGSAAPVSPDESEIEKINQEQLMKARQLLAAAPAASFSALAVEQPPDAVPDAADVDVSGEDGVDSVELTLRLISMMEEGQTFIYYSLGEQPRRQKLFYRNPHPPEEGLPGFLYLCDVNQRPLELDVTHLKSLDLCSVSDIYLGKQAPAFHNGVPPASANVEDDDLVSFSLVTANSVSLNVEALSAKQRAAWILAIMAVLKQPEDDQEPEPLQ